MTVTQESFIGPFEFRKFIDHRISASETEDVSAILYEYLMTGNGLLMRAARSEFMASLPLCIRPINCLPKAEIGITWQVPKIGQFLWGKILRHAQSKSSSSRFEEEVYAIYWNKSESTWQWKAISRERRWASTIADDSLDEYRDACIELHTHPPGAIHFSRADDLDESGKFRIFAILVDIHETPKIRFRCGIYDNFFPIPATWVGDLPNEVIDLTEIDIIAQALFS